MALTKSWRSFLQWQYHSQRGQSEAHYFGLNEVDNIIGAEMFEDI